MEYNNKLIFYLIVLLLSTPSCKLIVKNNNNDEDNFYKHSKYSDIYRIPLKKPYELYSADNGNIWFLDFKFGVNINIQKIDGVDSIGLNGDFVFAYCKNTYVPNKGMMPIWFVADIKNKKDTIFLNETEFNNYIIKCNIKNNSMYSPQDIYNNFDATGSLPW